MTVFLAKFDERSVPPLSFSFKSALSLTAFLNVASDSFITVKTDRI